MGAARQGARALLDAACGVHLLRSGLFRAAHFAAFNLVATRIFRYGVFCQRHRLGPFGHLVRHHPAVPLSPQQNPDAAAQNPRACRLGRAGHVLGRLHTRGPSGQRAGPDGRHRGHDPHSTVMSTVTIHRTDHAQKDHGHLLPADFQQPADRLGQRAGLGPRPKLESARTHLARSGLRSHDGWHLACAGATLGQRKSPNDLATAKSGARNRAGTTPAPGAIAVLAHAHARAQDAADSGVTGTRHTKPPQRKPGTRQPRHPGHEGHH